MEAGGGAGARRPALLLFLVAAALGARTEAEEPRPARQRGDEQCHYYAGGQVYPGEAARLPVSDHSLHLSQAKSRCRARPGLRGAAGPGRGCARSAPGAAERGGGSATSGGARGLPQPCPAPPHGGSAGGLRGGLGGRGRAKERGARNGPRQLIPHLYFHRGHRRRLTGVQQGLWFQNWRTRSGKRFKGYTAVFCAHTASETMNGHLS